MEKECAICGVFFETNRKNRLYCDACSKRSDRMRARYEKDLANSKYHTYQYQVDPYAGVCKQCGKEFRTIKKLVFAWQVNDTENYEFCSKKCKHEYVRSVSSCRYCGESLEGVMYFNPDDWHSRFCNDACRAAWKKEEAIKNGNYRTCENCGKEFIRSEGRFCSRECYKDALRTGWKPEKKSAPPPRTIQRRERCVVCRKTEIIDYDYSMRNNLPGRWYCSKECFKKDRDRYYSKSIERGR